MEQYTSPTLEELRIDTIINQAAYDESFFMLCGSQPSIKFNPTSDGYQVQITTMKPQETVTLDGIVIAEIENNVWHWLHHNELPHAPLHGDVEFTQDIIDLARSVFGGKLLFFTPIPGKSGHYHAVIITSALPLSNPHYALALGLARIKHSSLPKEPAVIARTVHSFARTFGLAAHTNGQQIHLNNGSVVDTHTGELVSEQKNTTDLLAASALLSIESQFLFEATFSQANARCVSDQPGIELFTPQHKAPLHLRAALIATIRDNTWRWSYTDAQFAHYQIALPAIGLKKFGLDHNVSIFLAPEIDIAQARAQHYEIIGKQILGLWTHIIVNLDEHTRGVLLVDCAHILSLPQPTVHAVQATINAASDYPMRDTRLALESYAKARNIALDFDTHSYAHHAETTDIPAQPHTRQARLITTNGAVTVDFSDGLRLVS
ncbi:hypothetical protein EML15_06925 [Corynebacterium sp. sy017]|uniref:DUF6882 domain-containing protein n=1 Tax=unclassified Corynebacterium TaxID=2624378 RepID=UPI001186B275|nr:MULTISPECIES: DUF6882 domain-containing protein [unclassified Corynebacterium]MBP3088876.1 hypothetical protein [Corynebacterium sp. sy017]TSD91216.1 hypothetical protein ELY17_06935 [Corynebacterium sp. SY003]